jgi:O-glycosyl hydrolase
MKTTKTIITLLLFMMVSPVWAAVSMEVRPATTYQSVEGIGGGIVYYLDWIAKHEKCEEIYDTIYTGLGLSALRMGNWAQEEDADLTLDSLIYAAAKKRLGDDFYLSLTSWSPPASLKSNNDMKGTDGNGHSSLKWANGSFQYDQFGAWWKRSLEQYRAVGIYPDYVSLQNEVDCNPSYYGMELEPDESVNGVASYAKCLTAAAKAINKLENPPMIIGPEVLGIGWDRVQNYLSKADTKLLSAYSFHYYHSGRKEHEAIEQRYAYPDDFKEAMSGLYDTYSKENKPLFMTENSPLRDPVEMDPIYTAWFMSLAFTVNHVSSYTHWNLIWGDKGDACINIDTLLVDGEYQKIKGGYRVNGDYHALRHFSKFVKRGWRLLYATTSDADVLITAFRNPDDDEYTVILVNKGRSAKSLECSFFPEHCRAMVIQSDVPNKKWSEVLGVYDSLDVVALPANSITTIAYTPKNSKYIYGSDTLSSWNEPTSWTPEGVPSRRDTAVIGRGMVLMPVDLHVSSPVFIENGAVVYLDGSNRMDRVVSNGGGFLARTSGELTLDTLEVNAMTTIGVMSPDTSALMVMNGAVKGSEPLVKIGTDTLLPRVDASAFEGGWIVSGGAFRLEDDKALGAAGIDVVLGTMYVDCDAVTRHLYIGDNGNVVLNGSIEVKSAMIGPNNIYGGVYHAEDFPEYLSGEGMLIVDAPRPVLTRTVPHDTVQVLTTNDSIKPLVFHWENASTVEVDWNPIRPRGINVSIDDSSSYATISGKSDTVGTFIYEISTVGEYGPVASDSGRLVFNRPGTNSSEDVQALPHFSVSYQDGVVSIFSDISYDVNCYATISDMSGRVVGGNTIVLLPGANSFDVDALECGVYLLQIRGKGIYKTVKMVVE